MSRNWARGCVWACATKAHAHNRAKVFMSRLWTERGDRARLGEAGEVFEPILAIAETFGRNAGSVENAEVQTRNGCALLIANMATGFEGARATGKKHRQIVVVVFVAVAD